MLMVEDTSSFGMAVIRELLELVFIAERWIDSVVIWSESMSGLCM